MTFSLKKNRREHFQMHLLYVIFSQDNGTNIFDLIQVPLGTAIYECNKKCACAVSGSCYNRVVQKGATDGFLFLRE